MSSFAVGKKLVITSGLTFVAAVACSDAVREVATAMKRTDPTENALLRIGIAGAVILIVLIIAYLWSDEACADDSEPEIKDSAEKSQIQSPASTQVVQPSPSTASTLSTAQTVPTSMEDTNVAFKRASPPDTTISEPYNDYNDYMRTFI